MSNQRYMQRGVSASKEDVHNAIKNIDKGIFPQAFCKIIPDNGSPATRAKFNHRKIPFLIHCYPITISTKCSVPACICGIVSTFSWST